MFNQRNPFCNAIVLLLFGFTSCEAQLILEPEKWWGSGFTECNLSFSRIKCSQELLLGANPLPSKASDHKESKLVATPTIDNVTLTKERPSDEKLRLELDGNEDITAEILEKLEWSHNSIFWYRHSWDQAVLTLQTLSDPTWKIYSVCRQSEWLGAKPGIQQCQYAIVLRTLILDKNFPGATNFQIWETWSKLVEDWFRILLFPFNSELILKIQNPQKKEPLLPFHFIYSYRI